MTTLHQAALTFNPTEILLTAAVFALAGTVKGAIGLGLPTISMALLALIMTPPEAAALLVVPSLLTNIWQIRPLTTLFPMLRRMAPMQLGICAGTLVGTWYFGIASGTSVMIWLGFALIAYALWGLIGIQISVPRHTEKWLGLLIGVLTGLVTAATGVFVIPAVPYIQALGLEKDDLIQAMGISFNVSTITLAAALFMNSQYSSAIFGGSLLLVLPAIAGMHVGRLFRKKLHPEVFKRCFLGGLLVLGIHMVLHEMLR